MFFRVFCLSVLLASLASAQVKLTAAQLSSFVKSSIQLRHDDGKVAAYLKKVQLTEKLDDKVVEDLIGEGAGARTINALRELRDATKNLTEAAPAAAPKPIVGTTIAPPSQQEQDEVLKKVTEYAMAYDQRLPDFICAQVTRRYYDPSGLEFWRQADTVKARLTYFQNKEEKKVISVDNKFVDLDYDRLGGATSTGEFGSLLKQVFDPSSHADFSWARWATLRGKRMYVFAYRVPRAYAKWQLLYEKIQTDTPGYQGLVFVEKSTLQVMRVSLEAVDIRAAFPIQQASTQLDYDYEEISGQAFLLPLRAEMRMRSGRDLIKNEVEFRSYRKFGADTSITFSDMDEPLPAEKLEETPATKP